MSLKILQLSDLHLCGDKAPSPSSLLLDNSFSPPDIILVTGDIFDCHAFLKQEGDNEKDAKRIKNNIRKGVDFFNELIEKINSLYGTSLSKESVMFIPGNHELQREERSVKKGFELYKRFLDRFYNRQIPEWYLVDDFSFIREFKEEKIILIGFRSAHVYGKADTIDEYEDYGLIEPDQLLNIRKRLHTIENRSDYHIISALHHQFILMEERDKSYVDKSYLRNSEQFIRFLCEEKVCAVLHGHKHVNSNRRLNIELDISKPEKIITVLGCGSLSMDDQENSFNIITVFPKGQKYELEYVSYKHTSSGYILDKAPVNIPVKKNDSDIIALESAIDEHPDIRHKYNSLICYDIYTKTDETYNVLNKTLFSLSEVVSHIKAFPDLLYFIVATAHYRSLIHRQGSDNVVNKIKEFLFEKNEQYFNDNSCIYDILQLVDIHNLGTIYQKKTKTLNTKQKCIVVFVSITTIVIEFYQIIKYESKKFYRNVISKKIDFSYSAENLICEIQGNSITFTIDDERRLLEIGITCDTAEAVKVCSLIVKEFEMLLHPFERDFAFYGFRVYYVLPRLNIYGRATNAIESRQFLAYIPKLLPLLAGRNIYSTPEAFAREVIQNSIDAINVRRQDDINYKEEGLIEIEIKESPDGLSYFQIRDNGSGMTKYILERYLTTLGLSYYSETDYQSLNINYNPISQFGIGFLSCFMMGKHVEVHTRHYTSDVGYFLDIPNYDGCFFIEEERSPTPIGTTIRIWENPELKNTKYQMSFNKIKKYIYTYIKNPDVKIIINNKHVISKRNMFNVIKNRTKKYGIYHYVPLYKDDESGKWSAMLPTLDGNEDERYGIWFYKNDERIFSTNSNKDEICLLNDGILVPNLSNSANVLRRLRNDYYEIVANIAPSAVNLDVSRDNLKEFHNIDWNSIQDAFVLYQYSFNGSRVPLYLLQRYYEEVKYKHKYGEDKLSFSFSNSNQQLLFNYKDEYEGKRLLAKEIFNFINYMGNNLFLQEHIIEPNSINSIDRKKLYDNNDRFTVNIVVDMFETIALFEGTCIEVNKYRQQKHDPTCHGKSIDVLQGTKQTFIKENINLAKRIHNYFISINKGNYDSNTHNNFIIQTIKQLSGKYYAIRNADMQHVLSYYNRHGYANKQQIEPTRINTYNDILNTLPYSSFVNSSLNVYLCNFLETAYSNLNYNVSLIEVIAVTISAFYSIFDLCSITCTLDQLRSGVEILVSRDSLLPHYYWWDYFSEQIRKTKKIDSAKNTKNTKNKYVRRG